MTNPRPIRHYLIALTLCAMTALALAAAFNAIVDPFGMTRLVDRGGFNTYKPAMHTRVRLMKAYEVRRIRPESILMGTSRSHLGFDPSHAGWAKLYDRRYNLAYDGATTKEMYYYLLHANATGHLKHVLLGLDTYQATTAPAMTRPGFDADILMNTPSWPRYLETAAADFRLLTSITTFTESLHTLEQQKTAQPEWFAQNGQRLGEIFFRRPGEAFHDKSPRYYFDEIDRSEVRNMLEWRIPAKEQKHVVQPAETQPETSLDYIRRIIAFCREHGIALTVFITPSHVHQMELTDACGDWPSVENGKRSLVRMLTQDAAIHPGAVPYPLYDFSGYSSITTETPPTEDSRAEMQYYWDSSHFKKIVGDMVLDRITGTASASTPGDFGVKLTPDNIEDHLRQIRFARESYRQSHQEEVATLRRWVKEFREANGIPNPTQ